MVCLFPSMPLNACSGILPRICCCRAMFAFPYGEETRTKTSDRSKSKRDRIGLRMPMHFEVYFCDIAKIEFDVNYVGAGQTMETFLSLLEASPWSPRIVFISNTISSLTPLYASDQPNTSLISPTTLQIYKENIEAKQEAISA